jgi:hypothetical protein
MKKLLLLFILSGVGLVNYAQVVDYRDKDHYVIKTNGDTIFGKLKYTSSDDIKNKIQVKENDTLKHTFKAEEIKFFKDGEKTYKSFQPDMEAYYFIRVWEEGKYLSLYEWQVPSEIDGNVGVYLAYVRQNDDRSYIQLETHWQKHLVEFISDNKELADEILKNKYKMEQLGDVVRHYNEWKAKNK